MKRWRFKIGDSVKLLSGHRRRPLRGVVTDRMVDDVGVEMIHVDCQEPGWWQADWWMLDTKRKDGE
jgi:hypothetical protein